jgi:autotransporter-associated beta strand protein
LHCLCIVALLVSVLIALSSAARAAVLTNGTTITVNTASPNPWPSPIGTGPSTASGTTVTLDPNAQVVVGDFNAISLQNNASITLSGGALAENFGDTSNGLQNAGPNTIEFRDNGTLKVLAGGTVYSAGPAPRAEAVNILGVDNVITNFGTIRDANGTPIFLDATSGSNTIINEVGGIIQAPNSTAVAIGIRNTAMNFATLNFTNMGKVMGGLSFGSSGNNQLHIYTGSIITGAIDGGTGGNNLMTLNGTASDVTSGALTNWQTLIKQDTGTWTLTDSVGNNDGASPLAVEVQAGTLVLTGNNSSFNGTMTVDPAGTLQGTSSTLMPAITNNGLVDFVQPTDGTYAGTISGSGTVAKDGAGVLTLTGPNTYSGGTIFNAGTVAVSADSNLGAPTGPLTFKGGTLQFSNSFNLSASRPITLDAPGGTIDTQGFTTTIAQDIKGVGALTKTGIGTLTLTGTNTYSGGTVINTGTLKLGDGGVTGSIVGNVIDSGTLTFDRSDTVTFTGLISGSGALVQAGSGTTILTGDNTYSGGTTITQGTLQIGNGGVTGNIVGNVTVTFYPDFSDHPHR